MQGPLRRVAGAQFRSADLVGHQVEWVEGFGSASRTCTGEVTSADFDPKAVLVRGTLDGEPYLYYVPLRKLWVLRPVWSCTPAARAVLTWCWELGLRPPAGEYILQPQRGQTWALGDGGAPKTPLIVQGEGWEVQADSSVAMLRRWRAAGLLQATQRATVLAPHRLGHHLPGFHGVRLLPPGMGTVAIQCNGCTSPLKWWPMPRHEHHQVEPAPMHVRHPYCQTWLSGRGPHGRKVER